MLETLDHVKRYRYYTDGSSFKGTLAENKRSGEGVYTWKNGDSYTGNWYEDYRHGLGEYRWESGDVFKGFFFKNKREGYGFMCYKNGNKFRGLYKNDKRYGPGIFTYASDNTQDIGYWDGDRLIRLVLPIDFHINVPKINDLYRKIYIPSWYNREAILKSIFNSTIIFLQHNHDDSLLELLLDDKFLQSVLVHEDSFIDEYLKILKKNRDEFIANKMTVSLNLNSNLLSIFKHQQKHEVFENFAKLNLGYDNDDFKFKFEKGLLESKSIEFLKAALNGELEIVKFLLEYVHVDVCDSKGYTALVLASIRGHISLVNYLLDNGANVNHLIDNGLNALMICISQIYSLSTETPFNLIFQHVDPETSVTAIHSKKKIISKFQTIKEVDEVAQVLSNDILKVLLQRGADPTAHLVIYPALAHVLAHGDVEIAKLLIQKGANCIQRLPLHGHPTPLCIAVGLQDFKSLELVKCLLDHNANPNDFIEVGKEYILMSVKGFECQVLNTQTKISLTGRSPLHLACSRNDAISEELVRLLLNNSANPNLICNGQSPLTLAIALGNKSAIDVLLSSQSLDINLPLSNGVGSALTVACSPLFDNNWSLDDKMNLVRKLVSHGADMLLPIVYDNNEQLGSIIDYVYKIYLPDSKYPSGRLKSGKLLQSNEKDKSIFIFQAFLIRLFRAKAKDYIENGGQTFKCRKFLTLIIKI